MKLIPFEKIENIIKWWEDRNNRFDDSNEYPILKTWIEIIRNKIQEIDTIDSKTIDPIEIIDEMIDELLPDSSFWTGIINSHKIDALQELKSRLTNNN